MQGGADFMEHGIDSARLLLPGVCFIFVKLLLQSVAAADATDNAVNGRLLNLLRSVRSEVPPDPHVFIGRQ